MSNFLKENQKNEFRYKSKDGKIILYNPTDEQYEELTEILKKSTSIDSNNNTLEIRYVREIIRNFVEGGNFVDEYSDVQLIQEIENGNRQIKLLMREIEALVQEILDDIFYDYTQKLKEINGLINIANSNKDLEKLKIKTNKFFKKYKIDILFDDFIKVINNPDVMKELNNTLNK